jgi:CDP-diacylglycerol--serine O-phosphatidyltransferase
MANFPRRRFKTGAAPAEKAARFSKFARQSAPDPSGKKSLRRRGIYLLPNAFTTAALFCGFYAIVMAMNQKFENAAWAIFIAMILDGLDGRIARLTNTQSEFGAQYDSLSDMVSFGAAPALVIYEWSLRGMGKLGWLAAFVYCAGAALRLARFNTNIEIVDKRFFQGLPSPAAAAIVAGLILLMNDLQVPGVRLTWVCWAIVLVAGLSMVSNVPFYSFKDVNFRKSVPFIAVFLIVLGFTLLSIDPPKVLFPIFIAYGLSGYGLYFWRLIKRRQTRMANAGSADQGERH